MPACPICETEATSKREATPYFDCPACHCWFQSPAPPKLYIGAHEPTPTEMGDDEKAANEWLAGWLYEKLLADKGDFNIVRSLDVGAKWPYLASRLASRGVDAWAMDGDPRAAEWGAQLGVNMTVDDFETMGIPAQRSLFDLITMVHVFEHLADPLKALRKLRLMVEPGGRVFIRMPLHDVTGYERDLTEGHYSIHPFYHCMQSLLQALVECGDCFVLESIRRMDGHGQADIVLRPIGARMTLAVGIIERNEERDLPKCLDSLALTGAEVFVIDTGSNDGTPAMLDERGIDWHVFTDASEWDAVAGRWRLQHFAQARNHAIETAEGSSANWYMWMDADDVLTTPQAVRRAMYNHDADVWGMWIQSGGYKWIHHRMWKMGKGLRFKGRCHEYLEMGAVRQGQLDDTLIVHNLEPGASQEDSNARNLRMLMLEWAEEPTPRTAFYLANTHKDGGRWDEAIEWYARRLAMGEGFRDEWLTALLYKARCHHAMGDYQSTLAVAKVGRATAPTWAEFIMQEAQALYQLKDYPLCIATASAAMDMPITPTPLWREPNAYRDQPARMISWCHEHMGNRGTALVWAELAAQRIDGHDQEWATRMARLRAPEAPAVSTKHDVIALCRPGAIGDIIMTLNLIPALRAANPGVPIWYFCDRNLGAPDALGSYMLQAGIDVVMDCAAWEQWAPTCARSVNLVGYPLSEGYPDKPMAHHLLQYFARELGVLEGANGLPALEIARPPRPGRPTFLPDAPYATIQRAAGWSKYKEWMPDRWEKVMQACAGMGIDLWPIGANEGLTLHDSIAAVANARMHIGIDSFANHLTHYYWLDGGNARKVPGVILWGSTQPSAAGYDTNANLHKPLECSPCFRESPKISRMPRGPCVNFMPGIPGPTIRPAVSYDEPGKHLCMDQITVDEVVEAIRLLWSATT